MATIYLPGTCNSLANLPGLRGDDLTWGLAIGFVLLFLVLCLPLFCLGNIPLLKCLLCCIKFKPKEVPAPPKKWEFFKQKNKWTIGLTIIKYIFPFTLFWIYCLLGAIIPWAVESNLEMQANLAIINGTNATLPAPIWTFGNSFYYTYQAIAAVGFGDLVPVSFGVRGYIMLLNFITHASFLSSMLVYSDPLFVLFGLSIAYICKFINYIYYTYLSYYVQQATKQKESENVTIRFTATFRIVILLIGFIFFHLIVGGIVLAFEKTWDFGIAIYWTFLITSSIGYGDFNPSTDGTKVVFIISSIFGYLYFVMIIRAIQSYYIDKPRKKFEKRVKVLAKLEKKEIEIKDVENKEEVKTEPDPPQSTLEYIKAKAIKYLFRNFTLFWYVLLYFALLFILPLPIYFLEVANETLQFGDVQNWTYLSFCYFVYSSVTAVGFGDYFPSLPVTRAYLVYTTHILILYHYYLILVWHTPLYNTFSKIVRFFIGLCKRSTSNEKVSTALRRLSTYFIEPIGKIVLGTVCFAIHMVISGAIICALEGWDYFSGVYFAYMTLSTVGLVDQVPVTDSGKVYTVSILITGISFFLLTQRFVVELFYIKPYDFLTELITGKVVADTED
jgi:MFS family permease